MPQTFSGKVAGFKGQKVTFPRDSGTGSFGKATFPYKNGTKVTYKGQKRTQ